MTAPDRPSDEVTRPARYRAGMVTSYRVVDTVTGDQLSGHAVVLKVNGDVVDLAVLGVGHLQTHVDNVQPAKVDEVPNPLPAPDAPAGDDTSS